MGAIVVLLLMALAVLPRAPRAARREAAGGSAPEPPAARLPPAREPAPGAAGRRPGEADPAAPQPARETALRRTTEPRAVARGRLAVVIDDVGNNLEDLAPFLQIPGPLTFAVLPALPHSGEAARRVHAAGKQVIVHMPMEAAGGQNPGPGAIFVDQSDAEVRERLERALESVPYAQGINNHMGSRVIADSRVMAVVMDTLADHGLSFLDSRTTADTVAAVAAAQRGVPFLQRSVFLDNVADADKIEEQLAKGVELALEKGSAILIGHVQNEATREVLSRRLPELEARGIEQVTLAALSP